MRYYDINLAQSRLAYGQVTWLVRLVQNWRMRKVLKSLRSHCEYQLKDIGLDRCELERLIALPLTCDHVMETDRRRLLAEPKPVLALPSLGRAALPYSEQPTRNLSGIIYIGLAKKRQKVSFLSAQHG